ncbi:ABC transporter permease [Enterococcus sp. AD013-P3]|uniref:ABC transporter permease n=1 Tax=Enterococcus sp. AD013-P3 TaxID=3411036 RepID=UPI003B95CF8F
MKKYGAVFKIRFSNTLQYRTAAVAGMVTQFVWGLMEILAFYAFYQADPAAFPMSFQQTVSYIWLQQAFLALFMLWFYDNDILTAISSGSIAYELVRPMDLYSRWFCQSAANRLARSLLRCAPILFIAFVLPAPFRLVLPANLFQLGMFCVAMTLTLGVVIAISMLVYVSTFYTINSVGVRLVMASFADFFSGAVIPLPFFPPAFRQIAELLPFAAMQNIPLRIYNGNLTGTALWQGLGLQLFWLSLLILLGKLSLQQALKKVIVQGG